MEISKRCGRHGRVQNDLCVGWNNGKWKGGQLDKVLHTVSPAQRKWRTHSATSVLASLWRYPTNIYEQQNKFHQHEISARHLFFVICLCVSVCLYVNAFKFGTHLSNLPGILLWAMLVVPCFSTRRTLFRPWRSTPSAPIRTGGTACRKVGGYQMSTTWTQAIVG